MACAPAWSSRATPASCHISPSPASRILRCTTPREKNSRKHRYRNLVENRRVADGQVVQLQVLYLGEINDSQREVWRKSIEVFKDGRSAPRTVGSLVKTF